MFQVFMHYVWLKVLIEGKIWHLDIPEEVLDLLAALDKLTQTQRADRTTNARVAQQRKAVAAISPETTRAWFRNNHEQRAHKRILRQVLRRWKPRQTGSPEPARSQGL